MKKILKLISKAAVITLMLSLSSCYYDELQEIIVEVPDLPEGVEVSFRTDVEPIFSEDSNDCTACHNGTGLNPDLRTGSAYNAIVPDYVNDNDIEDAENSEFYQNLPGIGHPIDTGFELDVDQLSQIKGWISQGAQNN
ncbi:MAG: hypothetical protein WBM91_09610 [Eudoraea sp.]|uniref:hypothetical protein n=1 Tax=Eudoraea sp. TaxID=1979955 RepID=UPI003C72B4B8